jgi:hypothetical protein
MSATETSFISVKLSTMAVLVLLGTITATTAVAEHRDFSKVLVPVWTFDLLPGAHGSLWGTELIVYNATEQDLRLPEDIFPIGTQCPPFPSQQVIRRNRDESVCLGGGPAALVYVKKELVDDVLFSLRIREHSVGIAEHTEIPVVREESFFDTPIRLLTVPESRDRFRTTIRIYGPSGKKARVLVQLLGAGGREEPFAERVFELAEGDDPHVPSIPAYKEFLLDESVFEELRGGLRGSHFLVKVTPLEPGQSLWAMATVTDRVYQTVNVILPQ